MKATRTILILLLGSVGHYLTEQGPLAANPFAQHSVLVGDPFNPRVLEFTPEGTLIRTLFAPYPGTWFGAVRGLGVDEAGRLQVFNGPFDPYLSTYDPLTETWTQHTHAGWSSVNCYPCGGLDVLGSYVFVGDMSTAGAEEKGIVRFNTTDYSSVRFGDTTEYSDLAVGLDGRLYARRADLTDPPPPTVVDVYDPATTTLVDTIVLEEHALTLAVDSQGHLYAGTLDGILEYAADGHVLSTHPLNGAGFLYDIDMGVDGWVVAASDSGVIFVLDPLLHPVSSFQAGIGFSAYVVLVDAPSTAASIDLTIAPGPGPSDATLQWTGNQQVSQVYRSTDPRTVLFPSNLLEETTSHSFVDPTAPSDLLFYQVIEKPISPATVIDGAEDRILLTGTVIGSGDPFEGEVLVEGRHHLR